MRNLYDRIINILFGNTADRITKALTVAAAIYISIIVVKMIAQWMH